jgi:hypothetical protein
VVLQNVSAYAAIQFNYRLKIPTSTDDSLKVLSVRDLKYEEGCLQQHNNIEYEEGYLQQHNSIQYEERYTCHNKTTLHMKNGGCNNITALIMKGGTCNNITASCVKKKKKKRHFKYERGACNNLAISIICRNASINRTASCLTCKNTRDSRHQQDKPNLEVKIQGHISNRGTDNSPQTAEATQLLKIKRVNIRKHDSVNHKCSSNNKAATNRGNSANKDRDIIDKAKNTIASVSDTIKR